MFYFEFGQFYSINAAIFRQLYLHENGEKAERKRNKHLLSKLSGEREKKHNHIVNPIESTVLFPWF